MKMLDRLEEALVASLLAAMTIVVFYGVVIRYASGVSFLYPMVRHLDTSWIIELAIFMGVWMAKFGAALGVRKGIHVGVDVLVNQLSPDNRKKMVLFALFCGALFTGIVAVIAGLWVEETRHAATETETLEWPSWIVFLCVPVASALMCFRFLQVAWTFLRTGTLPAHSHAHVEGIEDEHAQSKA